MIYVIEIGAVILAFAILVRMGILLVRNVLGLGRTAKVMQEHVQPKLMVLMSGGNAAQQRVLSITGNADLLQRKAAALMTAVSRLMVIVNAFVEARSRMVQAIHRLGF